MSTGTAHGPRVVVIGAINVDFVVSCDHLPGPGETVVGAGVERYGGGKGANAAVAAARAGAQVSLIGAVGSDDTAAIALSDLLAAGADCHGVARLDDTPTGVALIVVDRDGENQIAVGAGANAVLDAEWVRTALEPVLPDAGCVLVSTEIPGDAVVAAVEAAAAAGVTCVLNTAPPIRAVAELLGRGPVLTPNTHELAALTAMLGPAGGRGDGLALGEGEAASAVDKSQWTVVQARATELAGRTRAPVVVTLGGGGAALVTQDGEAELIAAPLVEVRDTTGAGDTFNGVLATRMAAGDEMAAAVRMAISAASLSVSHAGARGGMPDAEAIVEAMRASYGQPI